MKLTRCKGPNSKCFLLAYLMIVGLLLTLLLNKRSILQHDTRTIPSRMAPYLVSPAKPLPDFVLHTDKKLALTSKWLKNKWTFVYFSFRHCLPACQAALTTIKGLQQRFATRDIQFLIIDIDSHDNAKDLAAFLQSQGIAATPATGDPDTITTLAKAFVALYLQTDFPDGRYMIEQKHHLFLVDPKGRLYADFRPPYSDRLLTQRFILLRQFYARTE